MTRTFVTGQQLTGQDAAYINSHLLAGITDRAAIDHELQIVIKCKRSLTTSDWHPTRQTPYCPYCGLRLTPQETND